MNKYHILVVDAEEDMCEILRFNLTNEGYLVNVAYSAEEAFTKNIHAYNLLLLEVALGKISGFKMAHMIRNDPETETIPIIFLTGRDNENDRLTGFNLGADDYITKPFSLRELVARINAVIHRINTKETPVNNQVSYDKLHMNLTNKQVMLDGDEIKFTRKEFEILKLFIENTNQLFTRKDLLTLVWPEESYVLNRTVDVSITRIRKKIGPYGRNIVTKIGLGYCFEG
ncbi:MAG: response regulator transcription factor [Bacteroidota bacterium]|nr:response regulator transcription factor [Bacteroidota bacterium]